MTNLLIEHECSQCGAPIVLAEDDRLFQCEYCRVISYIFQRDYFRYVLPNTAADKQIIFAPYWRFRGMLFSCLSREIIRGFADFSYRGIESELFPRSLGLRSQALKLRFVSPDTKGSFLKPTLAFKEAIRGYRQLLNSSFSEPVSHQAFIGETLSLIYSPFHIAPSSRKPDTSQLFDGVLNKPVGLSLEDGDLSLLSSGDRPDWQISLIPALCPKCGWNLSGQRDALMLNCENCQAIWRSDGTRFRELEAAHISESGKDIAYLPFWRIRADVSGVRLDSYADMIRLANLPKVAKNGEDRFRFYFWVSAFKIRPRIFLTLSSRMTLSQPREELKTGLPDAPRHPVTLPHTAAGKSLKIILASFMKPRKTLSEKLGETDIKVRECLPVYVPFRERHHEFVQTAYRMAVNKNMLRLAENL